MDHDDLLEMNSALEQLLVCADLDDDHHELIERCLDEGYLNLDVTDKAMVRRLLNTRSSRSKGPGQGGGILQRYRERRQQSHTKPSATRRISSTKRASS